MKKKCPFCSEEIQFEAIKCKHCGEFLDVEIKSQSDDEFSRTKNNRSILTIIIVIVAIIFIYNFYNRLRARAEYERSVYESYEKKSDNYKLPSGKVIDLARVPSEYKYEVKTYLSYKDKRDSWREKAYESGYGSDAEYQVEIFEGIIEKFEIEHPRVLENSFKISTVRE